ncbi:MAG: polymerase [Microbacteriaceae bacterium]|jgi:DNA polymerase-4|nr:polymerase [Microbacteriaceae bacterium]
MSKQDGSGRQVSAADVDDSTATVLHVDMDAFFASVELLERPDLRGRPVIVAHDSARSVVTAATYEARKFGVNSAMPLAIAKRRCPQAIVLEPHFERYSHYSGLVMGICDELTPSVERLGIDEAFLDVAGSGKHIGSPIVVATLLRQRVLAETGLVCSVGAAATKFVAKLASSRAKPDGLLVIPREGTLDFLHPLPISGLWGVGGKTEETLRNRGVHTIGDLANTPVDVLRRIVGDAAGAKLHELAWGIDARTVQPRAEEKSIGHEVTFETDVTDPAVIRRELLRLSGMVAVRLRGGGAVGRTVVLKLRFGDFTTITRSRTLGEATDLGRRIYDEVSEVYAAVGKPNARVRLVGVRMEQLSEAGGGQMSLWDDDDGWREAEDVMDAVSARFGRGSVTQASLLGNRRGRGSEAKGFARDG